MGLVWGLIRGSSCCRLVLKVIMGTNERQGCLGNASSPSGVFIIFVVNLLTGADVVFG